MIQAIKIKNVYKIGTYNIIDITYNIIDITYDIIDITYNIIDIIIEF